MDTVDFTRFIFAFLFVVGMIGAIGMMLKKYGASQKWLGVQGGSGRLGVVEMRYLDTKRKLVLVRRDDVEHLLLLSDGDVTVIESGIRTDGKTGA